MIHKTFIGIDPGAKGFITILKDGEDSTETTHFSIADAHENQIAEYFSEMATMPSPIVCMEEVHAVYGSSAKSTFEFGKINGLLLGFIIANNLPYTLVQPKKWQNEIWITADKIWKSAGKIDTKRTSINAAHRLYPNTSLKRTPKCNKEDDNLVDSLLIATYAMRSNL